MPLLKKKPFPLMAAPGDISPDEEVWQIRFTHEIFTDYSEYLGRLNLFRQRIWACRITGRVHLTYEEALVSEREARERLSRFPEEFKPFVLQNVQFSMLKINDLVIMILGKLRDTFVEGEELLGKLGNSSLPCMITKVLACKGGASYEVRWLNESKDSISRSFLDKKNLIRRKIPFSRDLLKLFIKESTFQNNPWVVQNILAKEYGLPTKPPCELEDKITKYLEVDDVSTAKNIIDLTQTAHVQTSKISQKGKQLEIENIVYPIEDLLVKPCRDDPVFPDRPVPSVKFLIPMDDVGNLLMVWDFLSCFGKTLRLSPFSLNDFEEAIDFNGVSNLIAEAHVALLTLLINEHDEYYLLIQQKKRKETIGMDAWVRYLSDFLELESRTKLTGHMVKIKDGVYNGLHVRDKLEILGELVHWASSTEAIKEEIDKCIEKQRELMANKREEHVEELRKKREEKRLKKEKGDLTTSDSMHDHVEEDLHGDGDMKVPPSIETKHQGNSGSKLEVLKSRRELMKKNMAMEREKEVSRMKGLQRLRDESRAKANKERERKLKERRLELYEAKMEKLHIWTTSLGKDRHHNRYWFFHGDGRIFVESADHKRWGFYSSKEELDALMSSLNPKGVRELALQRRLEKHYTRICSALQKRSKEMVRRVGQEDTAILRRSVRISALPRDESETSSFLQYVNKW